MPTPNPFEPPRAPPEQSLTPGRRRQTTVLVVSLLISAVFAVLMMMVVPSYAKTLAGFGSELPILTKLVLHGYLAAWILPMAVLGSRFLWPNPMQREFLMMCCGIIAPLASFPLVIIILYLPIIQLAATA